MGDAEEIVSNGANGHTEKEPDARLAKRPRLLEANQVKNKATVVLGAQWGDEGKGKVVDMLAGDADIVARCQVLSILFLHLLNWGFLVRCKIIASCNSVFLMDITVRNKQLHMNLVTTVCFRCQNVQLYAIF